MDGAATLPLPGTPPSPPPPSLLRLSAAFALAFTAAPIAITVGPLLGRAVAPTPSLSTVPLAVQLLAMMAAGIPASMLMERIGRRRGFQVAMLIGAMGSLLVAWPGAGFGMLLAGSACIGLMLGTTQLFRFAAADLMADARSKAKAVGAVMMGGVVGAVAGPAIVIGMDAFADQPLRASYAVIGLLAVASFLVVQSTHFAPLKRATTVLTPPVAPSSRRPVIIGVAAAMIGYMAMSLIMTATPLAMADAGYSVRSTSFVIMAHALAMFGPSFWTGGFVQRFGARRVMAVGWLGLLAACLVNVADLGFPGFIVALILLGLGWNGMFVSGTALVAANQPAQGGARLQGINDLFVLGSAAAASLLSGVVVTATGWIPMQWWLVGGLVVAGLILWRGTVSLARPPAMPQ